MKRYGGIWDHLLSWDNLLRAARKAQRGKRGRPEVLSFNDHQEIELLRLWRELDQGTYRPGEFRSHWIDRPKPRLISAAPYRDRVVHHALLNVLEPILERHFHPHSFACRQGKGTHAAADRLQQLMGRYAYAMPCDIQKYFPSIDHQRLKQLFRRLIKDKRVLDLMDMIVDHSNPQELIVNYFPGDDLFTPVQRPRGLPIGNLTSQWFANWYLTPLDHFITSRLGLGAYVRYCDDFVLLHDDPQRLRDGFEEIRIFLQSWRLTVHEYRRQVGPIRAGLRFVGYRIWATHRLLGKKNIRAFRRRVRWMQRAYAQGRIGWEEVKPRLASWLGHARQANSQRLIRRLSRQWCFAGAQAENRPCSARRQLEQQSAQLPFSQPQQEHPGQPEQQQRIPVIAALGRSRLLRSPELAGLRTCRVW